MIFGKTQSQTPFAFKSEAVFFLEKLLGGGKLLCCNHLVNSLGFADEKPMAQICQVLCPRSQGLYEAEVILESRSSEWWCTWGWGELAPGVRNYHHELTFPNNVSDKIPLRITTLDTASSPTPCLFATPTLLLLMSSFMFSPINSDASLFKNHKQTKKSRIRSTPCFFYN